MWEFTTSSRRLHDESSMFANAKKNTQCNQFISAKIETIAKSRNGTGSL